MFIFPKDMMRKVSADLSDLDLELSKLGPISRDEDELESQQQEMKVSPQCQFVYSKS